MAPKDKKAAAVAAAPAYADQAANANAPSAASLPDGVVEALFFAAVPLGASPLG